MTLRQRIKEAADAFQGFFGGDPVTMAWAPGRVELLGNHTDYNLGRVLGVTIDLGVMVAMRPRADETLVFASANSGREPVATSLHRKSPFPGGTPEVWVNYPLGVLRILGRDNPKPTSGAEVAIWSDLPEGAGMSSSAALEVSSVMAWGRLYGYGVGDRESIMRIAWLAEREFVGVPCGILDQATVVFGDKNKVVSIDCKAETIDLMALPEALRFWVFNTLEARTLVDSRYAERHEECRRALEKLQENSAELKGLCDVKPSQLEEHKHQLEPLLWRRARHVVEENARVIEAIDWLSRSNAPLGELGDLLYRSHESSRTLFDNSTESLDLLVSLLKRQRDVVGARLTGGGFGGSVLAVTETEFGAENAEWVARVYQRETGQKVFPFAAGTGHGARVLRP